ncbi:hypothetical protein CgunFtcFv8_015662 [Champsocephalus gunnari]|uniref:Uncharacterized protein n=1 Tax=Champsocephalus gunnari TaxID=52237 RepID=A0AAN8C6T7_CHAGU|nr:hypothetical protein CgunFtcFv8_015662 [Champsocephalus gunnari]
MCSPRRFLHITGDPVGPDGLPMMKGMKESERTFDDKAIINRSKQGECGEGGTGPLPGHHPEREGAREQLRKEDHPIVGSQ